jgi:hypothetical protein
LENDNMGIPFALEGKDYNSKESLIHSDSGGMPQEPLHLQMFAMYHLASP